VRLTALQISDCVLGPMTYRSALPEPHNSRILRQPNGLLNPPNRSNTYRLTLYRLRETAREMSVSALSRRFPNVVAIEAAESNQVSGRWQNTGTLINGDDNYCSGVFEDCIQLAD
jgi:hypothetical protein